MKKSNEILIYMNAYENDMNWLLEKIGEINQKYTDSTPTNKFNIFSILRKSHDEVNLHSRFIGEILDKEGVHGQKAKFAKLFLETLNIDDFLLENYKTKREYKNIDLLLTNNKKAIIIENKIWAKDQEAQLERYYDIIKSENYSDKDIHIIYLTPFGKEPAESSLGKLKDKMEVKLISYDKHITDWLEKCINLSLETPSIKEILIQYLNLIKELTGNTMSDKHKNEIIELLFIQDNMSLARKIVESWDDAKLKVELIFWNDLSIVIERDGYKILEEKKYSEEKLKGTKDRFLCGIMFEIGKLKGNSICMYIERGEDADNTYYGIQIMGD